MLRISSLRKSEGALRDVPTINSHRVCGERGCNKRAITPGGWCYAHDRLMADAYGPNPTALLVAGILLGICLAGAILALIAAMR